MNNHFSVNDVYIGKAVKRYGLSTGIDKSTITKSLYLFKERLARDEWLVSLNAIYLLAFKLSSTNLFNGTNNKV